MAISSLPSPYGIGTLGKAACDFIDFLSAARQGYWQVLPAGQTSYGDSPYQSVSTYAGNPYFIDLDVLVEEDLLTPADLEGIDWGDDETRVDYGKLYASRYEVLRKAFERGRSRDREAQGRFAAQHQDWLPDYALFMAVKKHFDMKAWYEWPDEAIRMKRPEAVASYRESLAEDVAFYAYLQFLFDRQWQKMRSYAKEKGIKIIGDLPIYVPMDSADVWASPESFQLDEKNVPVEVAGVPPDYFSEDGQLWGNPLYNWDAMKADGYGWWIRRIGGAAALYDVLRIDHFRGLESYWAVPYGETTAKNGRWVKGPGMDLMSALIGWYPQVKFIAEDLGFLTPEVRQLLKDSGLPGMKVLEFAFDSREPSDYLPHTYSPHCICYAGTHDNATLMEWRDEADPDDIAYAKKYLGLNDEEGFCRGIIRGGMSSVAELFVAQMQDYLELGAEARMNTPGVLGGNWQWRMKAGAATDKLAKEIAEMTVMYGRAARVTEDK